VYAARLTHGPVELAFTDRHGGVSDAPFDSLNLAWAGGDEPDAMAENHRIVMADFAPGSGLEGLAQLSQVHGNDVAVVGADGPAHDVHGHLHAVGDGLVTTRPGVSLMVRAADCVPVLLADPVAGVVAAVHAGREGLRQGVLPAALSAMAGLGARARHVTALLGPAVCGLDYEVPEAMQAEVARVAPEAAVATRRGTAGLDLRAGVEAILRRAGIPEVVQDPRCTVEDPTLFSHRRDGVTGRQAGLVWLG
jgi:polyphenol oxidase